MRQRHASHEVAAASGGRRLATPLFRSLYWNESIFFLVLALFKYLSTRNEEQRGLALGEAVLQGLEGYSDKILTGQLGVELAGVVDYIAGRQLNLKQYEAAEVTYQKALTLLRANKTVEPHHISRGTAAIYHQLGMVAQKQHQWKQAEQYYHKALEIEIELNARKGQATTYQGLGALAIEQRQWKHADNVP